MIESRNALYFGSGESSGGNGELLNIGRSALPWCAAAFFFRYPSLNRRGLLKHLGDSIWCGSTWR